MPATGKRTPPSAGEPSKLHVAGGAEAEQAEACRCKEVKEKTPAQILKTMLRDLAFWKKRDD